MRTGTEPSYSTVAIHAENSVSKRIAFVLKPFVERRCSLAFWGHPDAFAMRRPATIDVINRQKLNMCFTTARAPSAAIGSEGIHLERSLSHPGLRLEFLFMLLSPSDPNLSVARFMGGGVCLVVGPALFFMRLVVQKALIAVLVVVSETSFSRARASLGRVPIFIRHEKHTSLRAPELSVP